MRRCLIAVAAALTLAGSASAGIALELRGTLAPASNAARVIATVESTCREFGWRFTRRSDAPAIAAVRPEGASRWFAIELHGRAIRASFDTARAGALAHARLVRLIDRLDPLLVDVRVDDATGFHASRDAAALRDRFRTRAAHRDARIAIALDAGREVIIDGRLYTDVLRPAREVYAYAEREIQHGRLDSADEALTAAIALTPDFARALARRAEVRAERNRLDDALADAHHAIRLKPKMPRGYYARAKVQVTRGSNRLALGDLDRVVALDPAHDEARLLRGLLHGEAGVLARAIPDLERVAASLLDAPDRDAVDAGTRGRALTAIEALAACYEASDRDTDADRMHDLLDRLRAPDTRRLVVDRDARIALERPVGWRLEDSAPDPRIRVRMRERATSNACRIAVMQAWGDIGDPSFRKVFDESVLKGLRRLGQAPRVVRRVSERAGALDVYRILIRNDATTCYWVACLNHGGKMLTIYLTSRQAPALAEASLERVLESIRASEAP